MGQAFPTDLAALELAAAAVWQLAVTRVFADEADNVELVRTLPELGLTAPSFEIEFRLQQDVLDPVGDRVRTMVVLRFAHRAGDEPDPGWRVYVRGNWPDRTDRFARVGPLNVRRLRKAFSPRRQPPGTPDRFALANDDIYVMEQTPRQDITAQLCLFVLQTELSAEPGVMTWLTTYISDNFTISIPEARQDIAGDIVLRLIGHKWWMETPQAWRQYVTAHRRAVERSYRRSYGSVLPDDLGDDGGSEDRLIAAIDGEPQSVDAFAPVYPAPRALPTSPTTTDACSVREASQCLGVSIGTIYSRIHKRQLPVLDTPGPFLIPRSALVRSSATTRLRDVIAAVAATRRCRVETARRRISRLRQRGHTLDQILHDR